MGGTPFEVRRRCPLAVSGHIRPAGRAPRLGANNGLRSALPVRKASGAVPTPPPSPKCLHLHQSDGADPWCRAGGARPELPGPAAPRANCYALHSHALSWRTPAPLRLCFAEGPRRAHLRGTKADLRLPGVPDLSEASASRGAALVPSPRGRPLTPTSSSGFPTIFTCVEREAQCGFVQRGK